MDLPGRASRTALNPCAPSVPSSGETNASDRCRASVQAGYRLCPEHEVITSRVRPRGGTLSGEHRDLNHQISKIRITVENVVCRLKKFRICREFYRNGPRHHGQFWGCVAGMVNLRMLGRVPQFTRLSGTQTGRGLASPCLLTGQLCGRSSRDRSKVESVRQHCTSCLHAHATTN
ncbi:transposase family protein [Deinococcus yunweiensis]|uniref:transposase family protein n=1 Tax=Deinococcus yunweiensis TaxID=367282 RepID=UPI00398F7DF6